MNFINHQSYHNPMKRCEWCESSDLMREYHDKEWGTPVHDDRLLFEFLILEGAQAGLSWSTVLNKRKEYKKAFDNFDAVKVSKYNEKKIKQLLSNAGIIRNKLKIASAITNAKHFFEVKEEFGTFDRYIWQFTNYKIITNHPKSLKEIPAKSPESDAMSYDLKKRGFKFVGSTICYAFMQAVGMVDDHTTYCFRKN